MTTGRYVDAWRTAGIISAEQHAVLSAIARKERFPVYLELNALLYLGVVAVGAGLAWTVREHFAGLGDLAILTGLAAICAGSVVYCATRAQPYSRERIESPAFAFDYVLYLGCLAFGIGLGYLEYRFHLLHDRWDACMLASAALYFVFAYRFDNRFVLSLALSALAGWFGVRVSTWWHLMPDTIRGLAVVYGALVAGVGAMTARLRVKAHFVDAYMHVAANAALLALTSGAIEDDAASWWLVGLVAASAATVMLGVRFKRFALAVYGVAYAYVGVSAQMVRAIHGATGVLTYFVVSGLTVVGGLVVMSRRFGREP